MTNLLTNTLPDGSPTSTIRQYPDLYQDIPIPSKRFPYFTALSDRMRTLENLQHYLLDSFHSHTMQVLYAEISEIYPTLEREPLKQDVHALLDCAGIDNWDGEGAVALDRETVGIAQALVDRLPSYVSRPDVAATPHGEVDFDWVVDRDAMLTVSATPSKDIVFAGLFNGARLNGREPWDGSLPHFVRCCFERLHAVSSK